MKTAKTPMNVAHGYRLEPDCNDDATVSLAISAKRIADALEEQNKIASHLSDELRG